jgi:hypothetical protein
MCHTASPFLSVTNNVGMASNVTICEQEEAAAQQRHIALRILELQRMTAAAFAAAHGIPISSATAMPEDEARWLLAHPRCIGWVQERIAEAARTSAEEHVMAVAPRKIPEPQEPLQRRRINALRAQAHSMRSGWRRRAAGKTLI